MKRSLLIIFVITVLLNNSEAQISVGLKTDISGIPFNGYYDSFIYNPEKKISFVHYANSFEVGHYYDTLGIKHNGFIKFENKKIWYKKYSYDFEKKLKPIEVQSVVIGIDSFFVANKFYFKNTLKTKPEFVKYITEIDGKTYAKHYHFTSSIEQKYGGKPSIIKTYLVKDKDEGVWLNFPNNEKFKERALRYFGHFPILKKKIEADLLYYDTMLSLIKMADYISKNENNEVIYFNKYWQEVRYSFEATYYAKLDNYTDTLWTLSYYNDSMKLYTINYKSFYLNRKEGDYTSYHKNGNIRQIIKFKNDKPQNIKVYNESGNLLSNYSYKRVYNPENSKLNVSLVYNSVIDSNGLEINKTSGLAVLNRFDSFSNVRYTSEYQKEKLNRSYRILENDTVFQIVNNEHKIKLNSLRNTFNFESKNFDIDNAIGENAQGILLLSFMIDEKGYVIKCDRLNNLHPEIDSSMDAFIAKRITNRLESFKFKPYKLNKKKRKCEFIVPFKFEIIRFYREPSHFNYHNLFWPNYHYFNPNVPTFKPPSLPSFPY